MFDNGMNRYSWSQDLEGIKAAPRPNAKAPPPLLAGAAGAAIGLNLVNLVNCINYFLDLPSWQHIPCEKSYVEEF